MITTSQRNPVLVAEEPFGFLSVCTPELQAAGHLVESVRKGSDALRQLEQSAEPMVALIDFNLVFDLIVAEMTWRPECSSNEEYCDLYLLPFGRYQLMTAPTMPPLYTQWLARHCRRLHALAQRHAITLILPYGFDLPEELEQARKALPPEDPISVFWPHGDWACDELLRRVEQANELANARLNANRSHRNRSYRRAA